MAAPDEPHARRLMWAVLENILYDDAFIYADNLMKSNRLKKTIDAVILQIIKKTYVPEWRIREIARAQLTMALYDDEYKAHCTDRKLHRYDSDVDYFMEQLRGARVVHDTERGTAAFKKKSREDLARELADGMAVLDDTETTGARLREAKDK